MRKITAIVILSLLPSLTIPAQETKEISKSSNSSSTEEYTKFRFGGYGEMVANFKDYGINRFYGSTSLGKFSKMAPATGPQFHS